MHCLTILAGEETRLDDLLLDLYLYYGSIGLGMASPKLRAGTVAMLATLFPVAENMITPMFGQLVSLAGSDKWWEMHAHLLTLCGALLEGEMHHRMDKQHGNSLDLAELNLNSIQSHSIMQLKLTLTLPLT